MQPLLRSLRGQSGFDGSNELGRTGGDVHQPPDAVRRDHVRNGGRDDWQPGSKIFRSFSRADESGGLIQRERQKTHIPASKIVWKSLIWSSSEVVNVRSMRQVRFSDLHY